MISIIDTLKKLAGTLWLICFVVLSVTGFGPWLILQKRLAGYHLMIHATFAPVFALCTAALAVMYAHYMRFDKSDGIFLSRIFRRRKPDEKLVGDGFVIVMKLSFWLICVLSVPLFLSSVLSMFRLFGTTGQEILFQTHRYSALFFGFAAVVYTLLALRKTASK